MRQLNSPVGGDGSRGALALEAGRKGRALAGGRQCRGLAGLVALVLVLAGCMGEGTGGDGQRGAPAASAAPAANQTLNVFSFSRPNSFDPAKQGPATFGGNGLRRQYTEALLKPDPGAREVGVSPATAARYEVSDNGLVYEFQIRENARYNDGQPVKAGDFVFAWRRLIDPRTASPTASHFARVIKGGEAAAALGPEAAAGTIEAALDGLGLRAVDDRTFQVTLARPAPYFPWIATLTAGAPIRRDVVDKYGPEWANDPATLITNGPFKVTEMGQSAITMVPNPHYWDKGKPKLKKFVANYGLGPAPRWTKYLNDELDVSNGPPDASREAALADPQFRDEILTFPELSIQWLQFNTKKPPFDNAKVRLAIAQAIDRVAYNKLPVDTGRPATTLIPEGMPGYSPELGASQEFDPQQAKATLRGVGVDPRQLDGVELLTATAQEPNALFIADQLKKHLGITVGVVPLDSATLKARVKQGDYAVQNTFIGHAASYPDPQDFFDVFLSSGAENQSGWENAEYSRLVRQADQTLDTDKRLALYDEAHKILVEEAPVVFLAQLDRVFWVKPWVRGITRTRIDTAFLPGDLYSKNIWIAAH